MVSPVCVSSVYNHVESCFLDFLILCHDLLYIRRSTLQVPFFQLRNFLSWKLLFLFWVSHFTMLVSNAMLSYYLYFLFTLFYILTNSIRNIQQHRFKNQSTVYALWKSFKISNLVTKVKRVAWSASQFTQKPI